MNIYLYQPNYLFINGKWVAFILSFSSLVDQSKYFFIIRHMHPHNYAAFFSPCRVQISIIDTHRKASHWQQSSRIKPPTFQLADSPSAWSPSLFSWVTSPPKTLSEMTAPAQHIGSLCTWVKWECEKRKITHYDVVLSLVTASCSQANWVLTCSSVDHIVNTVDITAKLVICCNWKL